MRDLTRLRTAFVRERANLAYRFHKALETSNIKLGALVSDRLAVSGRLTLHQLFKQKNPDPNELEQLAVRMPKTQISR